jgi:nicotinamide-nucleotide amidase
MMEAALIAQAAEVLEMLLASGLTVSTAESCTGGLISAALTHHAGSSRSVLGGAVTYSNAMKHRMLGVADPLFGAVGAVSPEVAEAMANGVLNLSGADIAVSVTGIAGPDGGTVDKPVGTVWLGLARRGRPTAPHPLTLHGDRESVRTQSASRALALVGEAARSR